ncbi:PREDICTED: DNA topoisomerase 1-like [Branchiostoma belcheri]|uniref:DNA topoisomerase 1-like n=1 Tax=Branchiostoma belcheri TaxID=7741 RepID=A0A6P4YV89_BRABE|nr:PREDICTED: DNA topoisomerase 1-like [Branchiostoma belcheri]
MADDFAANSVPGVSTDDLSRGNMLPAIQNVATAKSIFRLPDSDNNDCIQPYAIEYQDGGDDDHDDKSTKHDNNTCIQPYAVGYQEKEDNYAEKSSTFQTSPTDVSPPAVVEPEESPPQPADVASRPPDPLYVRWAGQRFWCTKRILDWQRQALRAREDPDAALKPVREYGEESAVLQNAENVEIGLEGHYENDKELGHYENDKEQRHYENDKEQRHYENDKQKEQRHYENDKEHRKYENDKEQRHYENDKQKVQRHYENDKEHRHYENDKEQRHYENDKQKEQRHYENDKKQRHYENDKEQRHYENDKEQRHYQNDEEHSNLSTHVYADLDPDFLAAQDAIQNVTAQPFYEMDVAPADEEQEQPFYKMDVTAAKDTEKQEQPFYEMKAASTDENEQVRNTKVTETLAVEDRTVETLAATSQEKMEKKPPGLLQTESLENTGVSIQAGSTPEEELERLYESRKTTGT